MDKSKNPVLFAADWAEQVLPIFESAYPTDDRPRKAIEAARSGASVLAARAAAFAAHAAARDATDIAAVYAARAAGHAAATIHVAAHAPHAAAYAAKAALEVTSRGTRWLSQPVHVCPAPTGTIAWIGHSSLALIACHRARRSRRLRPVTRTCPMSLEVAHARVLPGQSKQRPPPG